MWVGSHELSQQELEEIKVEQKQKEAFAVALIHWPKDPLNAALAVEPYNSHRAVFIAQFWVEDAYVKAHQAKLLSNPEELLPGKASLVFKAMSIADDNCAAPETRLKALRLASDIIGHTGSGGGGGLGGVIGGNANTMARARVMEVPVSVNVNEWEAMAIPQQHHLTTTYSVDDEE